MGETRNSNIKNFIENENWLEMELYCKNIKNKNSTFDLLELKKNLRNELDKKSFYNVKTSKECNIYSVIDNIEILKNLIFLSDNEEEIQEYTEYFNKNLDIIINFKINDADIEYSIIKELYYIASSNLLDNQSLIKLIDKANNNSKIFINNHQFFAEKTFLPNGINNMRLNIIEGKRKLYENIFDFMPLDYEKDYEKANILLFEIKKGIIPFGDNEEKNKKFEEYLELTLKAKHFNENIIFNNEYFLKNKNTPNENISNIQNNIVKSLFKVDNTQKKLTIKNIVNTITKLTKNSIKNISKIIRKPIKEIIKTCAKKILDTVFLISSAARAQDKINLTKVLNSDNINYHLKRKKNFKEGKNDSLQKRALRYINKCILYIDVCKKKVNKKKINLDIEKNSFKQKVNNYYNSNSCIKRIIVENIMVLNANKKLLENLNIKFDSYKNKYLEKIIQKNNFSNKKFEFESLYEKNKSEINYNYSINDLTKKNDSTNKDNVKNTFSNFSERNGEYLKYFEKINEIFDEVKKYSDFLSNSTNNTEDLFNKMADAYELDNIEKINKKNIVVLIEKAKILYSAANEKNKNIHYEENENKLIEDFKKTFNLIEKYIKNNPNDINAINEINELFYLKTEKNILNNELKIYGKKTPNIIYSKNFEKENIGQKNILNSVKPVKPMIKTRIDNNICDEKLIDNISENLIFNKKKIKKKVDTEITNLINPINQINPIFNSDNNDKIVVANIISDIDSNLRKIKEESPDIFERPSNIMKIIINKGVKFLKKYILKQKTENLNIKKIIYDIKYKFKLAISGNDIDDIKKNLNYIFEKLLQNTKYLYSKNGDELKNLLKEIVDTCKVMTKVSNKKEIFNSILLENNDLKNLINKFNFDNFIDKKLTEDKIAKQKEKIFINKKNNIERNITDKKITI